MPPMAGFISSPPLPGWQWWSVFGRWALTGSEWASVVVGGDYQVLALEAYKAVVGQQQFGRGALIGMVLLLPALFSF